MEVLQNYYNDSIKNINFTEIDEKNILNLKENFKILRILRFLVNQ